MWSNDCVNPRREKIIRKLLLVGGVLLSVCAFVSCGISPAEKAVTSIAGKYILQDNPSTYLELKADGTAYFRESGVTVSGNWKLEGDEIIANLAMGFTIRGKIKGNTIITEDGRTLVKE